MTAKRDKTSEAGLGRLLQKDERNKNFPLPRKQIYPAELRRKMWFGSEVTDQLDTPHCVGHAGYGWLQAGPVTNKPPFTPTQLYYMAQDRDEWPGRDYDGTSSLGLMKALKDVGYISEYRWAFDAQTVAEWLLTSGPIVAGTWWHLDMFMPHKKTGFIAPTGKKVGGHEYRLVGVDLDKPGPGGAKGALRIVNSWGANWGQHGRAWITIDDFDRLLKDDGDAVTALEVSVR
jgi:hypothetical protein